MAYGVFRRPPHVYYRRRSRWAPSVGAATVQKTASDSAGLVETSTISIDTSSAEGTLTETATIGISVHDELTATDLVLLLQAALAANDAAAIADAVTAIAVAANAQDQSTFGETSSLDDGGTPSAGVIGRHIGLAPNTAVVAAMVCGAVVTLVTRRALVTAKPPRTAVVTAKGARTALVTPRAALTAPVTAKGARTAIVTPNDRDAG